MPNRGGSRTQQSGGNMGRSMGLAGDARGHWDALHHHQPLTAKQLSSLLISNVFSLDTFVGAA